MRGRIHVCHLRELVKQGDAHALAELRMRRRIHVAYEDEEEDTCESWSNKVMPTPLLEFEALIIQTFCSPVI
jgi:hypothetical protein